jgi:uncharacterized protein (TIGR02996 family)
VELEAAILATGAIEPYLVYADWLLDRGDPRGEWIMLEHRGDREKADAHRVAFEAQVDRRIKPTWKLGFIDSARVDEWDDQNGEPPLSRAFRNFLRLSSSALLRELVFARCNGPDGTIGYDDLFDVLAEERAPALHSLVAGDFVYPDECEISWATIGDLSRLGRSTPNLRSLVLQGGAVTLGEIDLPELREFELRTGTISTITIQSITGARWPKLERLVIWFGQDTYGAEGGVDDLAPILRAEGLPNLKHLGLMNAEFTDELAIALEQAPILKQLESLSLAMGTLSDEGAAALARAPLEGLKRLDVSECFLTHAGVERLRSLGPDLAAEHQRMGTDDRYAVVGE